MQHLASVMAAVQGSAPAIAQTAWGTPPPTTLFSDSVGDSGSASVADAVAVRAVVALLVVTIFLQRFSVPLGSFDLPVVIPLGFAIIAYLVARGRLMISGPRAWTGLAALAVIAASSYLAARYSTQVHLSSLAVVVAIWSVWVLRAPGTARANRDGFRRVGRAFVAIMTALSVVGAVQLTSQFVGLWSYSDLVNDIVPSQFVLPGYNTSIPIVWDSPIHKSQAFVFVEPSAYSQYTAIAVVVAVLLGARLWQLAVLAVGLVSALSGTGLMLLAVGLLLVLFRVPRLIRGVYVIVGGAALAATLLSPAGDVLTGRLAEFDSETSSLSLRFNLPYQEVAAGMAELPQRWVTGAGPGAADRYLESGRERAGLYVVYTLPTKLLFEYGLIATAVFLGFLCLTLFRGPPSLVLPGTVLFWLFFLGGYLAAPYVVWAAWALSPAWGTRD